MVDTLMPTITIITVCYNSERTIENTIKSVINQDYPLIEYIIIDGNSKDKTLEITAKYIANISKQISEPDKGIYDAMNKGIVLATGDIVGILNSDDVLASNTIISEIVNIFNYHTDVDAVYGNITYFKDDVSRIQTRTWITKPYCSSFFDDGEVPPHPSLFVKKIVYNTIGLYFPDFKISSDYEFMLRAFKAHNYKPYYLNKFIANMRVGGESTRSFKNILIGNKEVRLAWRMNNIRPPFRFWFLRIIKKILQFVNR
ncbi:MAG: family 2 glycosyl transferase [Mucilaginibacter sp.]|nr:family 2 glycosyl transferase [Mucilaginibacter sp.]